MGTATLGRALRRCATGLGALTLFLLAVPSSSLRVVAVELAWLVAPLVALRWQTLALRGLLAQRQVVGVAVLFSFTAAAWTLGNVVRVLHELDVVPDDAAMVAVHGSYLLALTGGVAGSALRLRGLASGTLAARAVLDGLLLGTSSVWVALAFSAPRDDEWLWLYPALGITAVSMSAIVLIRVPNAALRRPWAFLCVAFSLVTAADGLWAFRAAEDAFRPGGARDLPWLAGCLMFGLAALAVRTDLAAPRTSRAAVASRREILLPYPFVIAAFAVGYLRHHEAPWGGSVMLVLGLALVARQILTVLENQHLAATLEAKVVERTAALRHQAEHDALTGLANRRCLGDELERAVGSGRSPSVVLVDLDDFKAVNDAAGHALGDRLLLAVAERLLASTRPGDVVARLGGDEFAVLLLDDPLGAAAQGVAARIIDDLSAPVDVGGQLVRCGGSAGVACLAGGSVTAEQLMRDADVAMYAAKGAGKNRYRLHSSEMRGELLRRQFVERRLRNALRDDELVVLYQPVVDLTSGRMLGAEALVRLPDAAGGLLEPVEFIPLAESLGLVGELGSSVLRQACAAAADWQELRPDGPPIELSVNVATEQLADASFPETIAAVLAQTGLDATLLTLEITEGALHDDGDLEAVIGALRALGVRLSVDDFGTGYSSLGRLGSLPVHELKIDRTFVVELGAHRGSALVDVVLGLAGQLGLEVVAEGIDDPSQVTALASRGCRRGQGYLFARPVPPELVPMLLRQPTLLPQHSTSLVDLL